MATSKYNNNDYYYYCCYCHGTASHRAQNKIRVLFFTPRRHSSISKPRSRNRSKFTENKEKKRTNKISPFLKRRIGRQEFYHGPPVSIERHRGAGLSKKKASYFFCPATNRRAARQLRTHYDCLGSTAAAITATVATATPLGHDPQEWGKSTTHHCARGALRASYSSTAAPRSCIANDSSSWLVGNHDKSEAVWSSSISMTDLWCIAIFIWLVILLFLNN